MSNSPQLEIRQRSAALRGEKTGIRELPVVSKFIDTTTCIGCKACEVACQEWNDLELVSTKQTGTYQTMPTLDANFWNLIKFREEEHDGALSWLMRKDQCMHCADPGCLKACPAPGAIVQYENGIVDVNPESCIGCGLCATGCPFDVPRFNSKTGKMSKCTLCVDRVSVGIEPACVKACPTGCLQFGTKEDMLALGEQRVATLKAAGHTQAALYDPPGVGGTGVVTVLAHADHPDWYGLPADPQIPASVWFSRKLLRPIGLLAMAGSVGAVLGHFLKFGPSEPVQPQPEVQPSVAGPEDIVVGDHIVRHRLSTRVVHWTTAIGFFGALLSGLPIWTPIFGWMANLFGGLSVCRWLHPWFGVAFVAATVAMFALWAKDMRMEHGDWGWLGPKALAYMRHTGGEDSDVGKYNGGQKLFFFAVAGLALVLLVTGLVLWFPRALAAPLPGLSWVIHDAGFIVFAVAIIGHIYLGTAALPGTFRSMTRGTVTKAWARLHHPRWYRQVTGESPKTGSAGGTAAGRSDAAK
jgi:formate dehydrogenase beta subunit/formate dehydrogenase gamma subunit